MNKIIKNRDVFQVMEDWAPKHLAYDWDNVGLQIGSYDRECTKVMVTLDVLESVVDEAVEKKVDLIIAHHPLLFKSIKQINTDETKGRIIQKLLNNKITVYAAHTNLDTATNGVSDMLCEALDIKDQKILMESSKEALYKLVVYVPATHLDEVKEALGNAGAGHIGDYSHCTFQSTGVGNFKPLEGTKPFIGEKGKTATVDEVKIETIVPEKLLPTVIKKMKQAHPYEEVAYDLFRLANEGTKYGAGRIANLSTEMTLNDLCSHVKHALEVPTLRVTGDLNRLVKSIAILGGSGADFIQIAKNKGADVYLTGDMTFHEAQDAWQMGLSVIDPGHHVEKVMKQATYRYLKKQHKTSNVEIIISHSNTEPFQFV